MDEKHIKLKKTLAQILKTKIISEEYQNQLNSPKLKKMNKRESSLLNNHNLAKIKQKPQPTN